jgi:hypothetical protein
MPTLLLSENLKGSDPLRTPRRREEDNIKIRTEVIGCDDVGWNHLAQTGGSGGLL